MNNQPAIAFSIVLNDMNRSDLAAYGFRSWVLQDIGSPYEIILNLFNDKRPFFETLCGGGSENCTVSIKTYVAPKVFNISAANNLGLHRAQGMYVVFANSDIIYPSAFLAVLREQLERFDLGYALCNRANLSERATKELRPASAYPGVGAMDFMAGWENVPGKTAGGGNSTPWIVERQTAFAVGGFDPKVFCHEDSDFSARVMHYLKRTRRQKVLVQFIDLMGYHLWHEGSDLYELSRLSKSIIEPRCQRLFNAPASDEDVVNTRLADEEDLLADMQRTPPLTVYGATKPVRKVLRPLLGTCIDLIGKRGHKGQPWLQW